MKIKLNVTTSELSQYDLGGFGTFGEMKRLDALKRKRKAIKLKCVVTLNDEFDESDIEKYIGAIKKLLLMFCISNSVKRIISRNIRPL